MMGNDIHPLPKIKTVRTEPLHARIESQLAAPAFPRFSDQPVEKNLTKPLGPVLRVGHEIVDVHQLAREQIFTEPVTCDGPDLALGFQIGQKISLRLLPNDLPHQRGFIQVYAQLF